MVFNPAYSKYSDSRQKPAVVMVHVLDFLFMRENCYLVYLRDISHIIEAMESKQESKKIRRACVNFNNLVFSPA